VLDYAVAVAALPSTISAGSAGLDCYALAAQLG
jgi:hypothetical protein